MLWNLVPKSGGGATPLDSIKTAITVGLFNLLTHLFDKIWTNYFDATVGTSDAFTNTMKNMNVAQSSAMINGYWYQNWNDLQEGSIMPQGDVVSSDHSFVFVDYVEMNGKTVAKIDAHQGYHVYMPQDVFNAEIAKSGCSCLIPTNKAINARRQISLIEWITELLQQVGLLYHKLS